MYKYEQVKFVEQFVYLTYVDSSGESDDVVIPIQNFYWKNQNMVADNPNKKNNNFKAFD